MDQHQGREKWHSKLSRILNSAACFSAAYLLFNYIHWIAMALVCRLLGFDTFVYYHGLKYIFNPRWGRKTVTMVYSVGPIVCLVLALLALYLYARFKRFRFIVNMFFVWSFVVGSSMFFAQSIIASLGTADDHSPFWQDFAIVTNWLGLPPVLVYVLNIPSLLVLMYFAVNTARIFLNFSYSYSKVGRVNRRRKYFLETVIVPFLVGAVITTAVTFPLGTETSQFSLVETFMFTHVVYLIVIAVYLFVAWYALNYIEVMRDDVLKYKGLQSPSIFMLVVLAALIAFVKFTSQGLHL